MDLIDRYLQAVKWWLPRKEKQDILSELAEDLRSQVEERERQLGRRLNESEVADLLKRRGDPLTVAGHFVLVPAADPVFTLLYRLVLKAVLLWIVAPLLLIVYVPALLQADRPWAVLLKAWSQGGVAVMFAVGMVTVGFAVAKWIRARTPHREWDPRRLPRVRDTRRIPRASSVASLVVTLLWLAWWVSVPMAGFDLKRAGIPWGPGVVWEDFYGRDFVPVALLALASMALYAVNLARPYWTRLRLGLRAAINGGFAVIVATVLLAHREEFLAQYQTLRAHASTLSQAELGAIITNVAVYSSFMIAAAIIAVVIAVDVVRALLYRPESPRGPAVATLP